MAIPKEHEFSSYVAMATSKLQSSDDSPHATTSAVEPLLESVRAYVGMVMHTRAAQESLLQRSPVGRWVDSQPTAARAFRALLGGKARRAFDPDAYASDLIHRATRLRTVEGFRSEPYFKKFTEDALRTEVADANTPEAATKRLRDYCRYFANWNPFQADGGIAQAFADYFYADRAQSMIADGKSCLEIAQKLRGAIAVLRTPFPKNLFLPVDPSQFLPPHRVEALDNTLAMFISQFDEDSLPIRRRDTTAKERALAFDLWRTFFRAFRSGRPKAIGYMLEFEGVKQGIDFRSLERMVADWRVRTVPAYRHLFRP